MSHKQKIRTVLTNPVLGGARVISSLTPTAGTGSRVENLSSLVQRSRFKLTGMVAAVLAANDYGSVKLCDLPNTQILVLGVIVDLSAAVAGTGSSLANVDLAVGTVATASAAFSNAGEKNLCPKIDCTAQGVIDGASGSTETNVLIAAGASNAVYLNVATGNITTDGSVTLDGFVDIIYLDIGKAT